MEITHRYIDLSKDKDYLLECHCKINYECESWWTKEIAYEQYQNKWFYLTSQIESFMNELRKSLKDVRSIAEIIEDSNQNKIAYLWVNFVEDKEFDFLYAEVQDIFVEEKYRHLGIGELLLEYAEEKANINKAKVIRSSTGSFNLSSIKLHEEMNYYQYRHNFEKLLIKEDD